MVVKEVFYMIKARVKEFNITYYYYVMPMSILFNGKEICFS